MLHYQVYFLMKFVLFGFIKRHIVLLKGGDSNFEV